MSNHTEKLVSVAEAEWIFFGGQTYKLNGKVIDGKKEYQDGAWQRVGDYWNFIGGAHQNLTGKDRGYPWSAAFISFCMHEAGAEDRFPYSAGHATYINAAIRNRDDGDAAAPIIAHRLHERPLQPGDLIGYWRGKKEITFDNARKTGWYQSHTDIVVEIKNKKAWTIGGNVGHSVTRRQVRLDADGYLIDKSCNWFVVIQNNM